VRAEVGVVHSAVISAPAPRLWRGSRRHIGDDIDRAGPRASSRRVRRQRMAGTPQHHCTTFGPAQFAWALGALRRGDDQGLGEAEHVDKEPDCRRCVRVAQGGQTVGAGVSVWLLVLTRRRRCRLGGMGALRRSTSGRASGQRAPLGCLNGPGRSSHIRQRAPARSRCPRRSSAPARSNRRMRAACFGAKPISSRNRSPKCLLLQPISSATSAMGHSPTGAQHQPPGSPSSAATDSGSEAFAPARHQGCRTVQTRSASTPAGPATLPARANPAHRVDDATR